MNKLLFFSALAEVTFTEARIDNISGYSSGVRPPVLINGELKSVTLETIDSKGFSILAPKLAKVKVIAPCNPFSVGSSYKIMSPSTQIGVIEIVKLQE